MPGFKGTVMNPGPSRNPAVFGEIRGFPVGSRWPGRRELCDDGVHAPLSAGIHGRSHEGAFSVVLSGGYEDDVDLGYEFTYTGQGGQGKRLKGTKWDSAQIEDQEWTRGNLALAISWRKKTLVRVIRGHTLKSAYAPAEGYRYDGLYTVEDANMKAGKSGFQVCLFRFVRCPNQLPLPGPNATIPMQQERPFRMNAIESRQSRSSSPELHEMQTVKPELTEETIWPSSPSSSPAPAVAPPTLEDHAEAPVHVKPEPDFPLGDSDESNKESVYMTEPQSPNSVLLHLSNKKQPSDQVIEKFDDQEKEKERVPLPVPSLKHLNSPHSANYQSERLNNQEKLAYGTSFASTSNNQRIPTQLLPDLHFKFNHHNQLKVIPFLIPTSLTPVTVIDLEEGEILE